MRVKTHAHSDWLKLASFKGVSSIMKRLLLLLVITIGVANSTEHEKCLERKFVHREMMAAPKVTSLREGSVLVVAVIDINGNVTSSEILSQEGDPRWGKEAVKAIERSLFQPADKICRFETRYIAKFE